jgi:two-component system, OmpR family, response regulator CpxR
MVVPKPMTSLQIPLTPFYQPVSGGQIGREREPRLAGRFEPVEPQVLMVSADADLCSSASELLSQNGFRVTTAPDGTQGLAQCLNTTYNLVIVDAELPVLDGFALIHELRTRSSVPVLLIASSDEHCMGALQAGADDFVLRPVGLGELLMRSHGIIRRTGKAGVPQAAVLRSEELSVNVRTHEAFLGEKLLPLTNIEFAILKCLIRNAGKIVSRDELAAVLYQRKSTPFERSIDVHISHLRKKIEGVGSSSIRTIRGIGYLLASAN